MSIVAVHGLQLLSTVMRSEDRIAMQVSRKSWVHFRPLVIEPFLRVRFFLCRIRRQFTFRVRLGSSFIQASGELAGEGLSRASTAVPCRTLARGGRVQLHPVLRRASTKCLIG